jgi:hypothetical protein
MNWDPIGVYKVQLMRQNPAVSSRLIQVCIRRICLLINRISGYIFTILFLKYNIEYLKLENNNIKLD